MFKSRAFPMKTLTLKFRGIKLKKRLCRATRWILRRPKNPTAYLRLDTASPPPPPVPREPRRTPVSRLLTWGRCLTSKTRRLCSAKPGSGYLPVGRDPQPVSAAADVPKGHLAVYVGQKDTDFRRVVVPVIYFNHPLFGKLLREAEEEFGYDHPGGITIPCGVSEFERVKTKIAAGRGGRCAARTALKRYY
ncbi:hypothetical protein BT93_E1189 [Corymbia citriodora subsp. variegata]|nr:hypothetical protein BT93_E1189 [Corymbia citriodora subsp. variegata]